MRYASVCSGIEAATVAWEPLGWQPAFFAEIDPFCSDLLAARYPHVPNLGDFTRIKAWHEPLDLLVGGTPCQSFSLAGERGGLADPRGQLALGFVQLLGRLRPRWFVWENVPGVLSSTRGRDLQAFLAALGELGYALCYRMLDAKYFGVPQCRRRIFAVGYLGDWRPPCAVLLEPQSLRGDSAPRAPAAASRPGAPAGSAGECGPRGEYVTATHSPPLCGRVGDPHRLDMAAYVVYPHQPTYAPTITRKGFKGTGGYSGDECQNLVLHPEAGTGPGRVRRLTVLEWERLMGVPDQYTAVPRELWRLLKHGVVGRTGRYRPATDGPRYRALGDSMAVPVVRWIGERIAIVERLRRQNSD